MKPINKEQFLDQLYERVEGYLDVVISKYQNLPSHLLCRPAADQGWSISQCLTHLNSYGDYYLPKIEAIVFENESDSIYNYVPGWLGTYFVNMMDAKKSDKKYKAAKQHLPLEADPKEAVALFIHQKERLLKCLQQAKGVDLGKERIPVSIQKLVKLKLGDVLSFLVMHDERHMQQMERISNEQARD